ncbi:hypothetical protein [Bacillus sp. 2205SS5-2]|uniref:hypothetical protein n=1 Tax=Bacillus sp. 2205SS5-2 TaxID=3109031 RepID=UPI003007F014
MGRTILSEMEKNKVVKLKARVDSGIYNDDDFKQIFAIVKNYDSEINLAQTKKICELVQYLYVVRKEDRVASVLNQFIDEVLPNQNLEGKKTCRSFSFVIDR